MQKVALNSNVIRIQNEYRRIILKNSKCMITPTTTLLPLLMFLLLLVTIISSTRGQTLHEIYVVSTNTHLLCTFSAPAWLFVRPPPPPLTDPRSLSNPELYYILTSDRNYTTWKRKPSPFPLIDAPPPPPTSPS